MAKLLIVDESTIVCAVFKELLEKCDCFDYEIVQSYADAKNLLKQKRYEYAVVSRTLPDAKNGEIIALFNKYNIAPIVYTSELNEELIESFESANIVEYILRHRFDNVEQVLKRLKQLQENKNIKIIIVHDSAIYRHYLKNSLAMHNFKVLAVSSAHKVIHKLELHSDTSLVIVDTHLKESNGMDAIELVKYIRKLERENLKVLALTYESHSYETSCFLNEGADDYLLDDASKDEFYVRVYQNLKTSC